MNFRIKIIVIALFGFCLLLSCSTKKDNFANRNYNALLAKNNILFNGQTAFDLGRKELAEKYRDNFWEILPVERLTVSGILKTDSTSFNSNFQKAEEKATKAIQKHSMNIEGEEANPKMDDAFLLLGKARYFDERFLPALESFNYILYKYAKSNKRIKANIWREKTNLRLDNHQTAIDNLKRLLKFEQMSDQEYADITATMGQAYINLNQLDSALVSLRTAASYTKKNEEKGRYGFIVGQLYLRLGKKDSANYAFNQVIKLKRKTSRAYIINAEIEKSNNFDYTQSEEEQQIFYKHLLKLEKNRENRPFLSKINRALALYYFKKKQDSLGISHLNKSLRSTENDPHLNSLNYQYLAEYHFNQSYYQAAGSYYDSTLLYLPKDSKLHRSITKKRENLDEVIKYELLVAEKDSIIQLVEMSDEEQITFFENYIKKLTAETTKQKKRSIVNTGIANFANTSSTISKESVFYFYNITAVGYGKTNFKTKWGDRKLEDNWRWSNKSTIGSIEEIQKENLVVNEQQKKVDKEKTPEYYIQQLPQDPKKIDSIRLERNFLNYQLGLIYKEKFKEYKLAIYKLEQVLKNKPEQKLIIPSKYHLYKLYTLSENDLAETMKQDIISNHPNSRYADILKNPEALLGANSQNSPNQTYVKLYKMFQQQQYEKVIDEVNTQIIIFRGSAIVPKLELLKATAIGRLKGFESYKKALVYVALNYPSNNEGKKAQKIIDTELNKLKFNSFVKQTEGKWKLIYPMAREHHKSWEILHKKITNLLQEEEITDLTISKDVYDSEQMFLVIHGFISKDFAKKFANTLQGNKKYKVSSDNFAILSKNYEIIQIHKNLPKYLKN